MTLDGSVSPQECVRLYKANIVLSQHRDVYNSERTQTQWGVCLLAAFRPDPQDPSYISGALTGSASAQVHVLMNAPRSLTPLQCLTRISLSRGSHRGFSYILLVDI